MSGGGVGQSLILGQLKSHLFPAEILAETVCMTNSDMYRLDISTFCFYEPMLFQIYDLWKFIKN